MVDPAGRPRCSWASSGDPALLAYHDTEWGVPLHDERALFELLSLEGAQAGLSWSTILRRREGYRRAFAGFKLAAVAAFGPGDEARLLADAGIVRNRAKVAATIGNARAWLALREAGMDPATHLWSFVGGAPIDSAWPDVSQIPAETEASGAMSADLRRRGFTFVGPTICYAFIQSAGMVNDHVIGCFRHAEIAALA
ncbi:MAG: DNA-3-methyladenine glycosylase I [Chloroflexota bacterium]|nr:DNA-3-methyladenine glycosylase I [Chloroflexota bacterium]